MPWVGTTLQPFSTPGHDTASAPGLAPLAPSPSSLGQSSATHKILISRALITGGSPGDNSSVASLPSDAQNWFLAAHARKCRALG